MVLWSACGPIVDSYEFPVERISLMFFCSSGASHHSKCWVRSRIVNRQLMISRFLREQAWWRLNSTGVSALRVARNAVALLDAAAYVADLPDDHPDVEALAVAGFDDGWQSIEDLPPFRTEVTIDTSRKAHRRRCHGA